MFGKDYNELEQLLDRLRKAKTYPGEIHACPICGGHLHVHFESYTRDDKSLLGIHAFCESCNATIAIDYAQSPPEWLNKTIYYAGVYGKTIQ